jgi:tRNA modification GTPase
MEKTIAALATPPGIGGIAVIRISGHESIQIANKIFRGKHDLNNVKSHTIHYGSIIENDEIIDTVTASVFIEPNSYTGENTVEISCHGGMIIANRILDLIFKTGAHQAEPGEFTKRAFLNGKLDLTQVEAVADIIHTVSVPGAATAARQLTGSFTQKLKDLRTKLLDISGLLELELDFAEEDLEFADRQKVIDKIDETTNYSQLLCSYTTMN